MGNYCLERESYKEAEQIRENKREKREKRRKAAEAIKAKLDDGSGFLDLIPFMKEKEKEPEFQVACLLALFRYTANKSKGDVLDLFEAGGIEATLNAMKKHPSESHVQQWGASLLWAVAALLPDKESAMVEDDALVYLIHAAQRFPKDPKLLHQVFGAIRNLVIRGEAGKQIIVEQGLTVLTSTLKDPALQTNQQLQEQVTAVIFCITSAGPTESKPVEGKDKDGQKGTTMTPDDRKKKVMECEIAEDLLKLMVTHVVCQNLVQTIAAVISNVSNCPAHRTALGKPYGGQCAINSIILMAKMAKDFTDLDPSTIDEESKEAFEKVRATVPETLLIACEALANLARNHAGNARKIVEEGGVDRMISTILLFTSTSLQMKGLDCLHTVLSALQVEYLERRTTVELTEVLREKISLLVLLFKHLSKRVKDQAIGDRCGEILEILSKGLPKWNMSDVSKASDILLLYLSKIGTKKQIGKKQNVNHEYEIVGRLCRILAACFNYETVEVSATDELKIRSPRESASPFSTPQKVKPVKTPMGPIIRHALIDRKILPKLFKILESIRARRRDYKAKPVALEGVLRVLVCFATYLDEAKVTTADQSDAFEIETHKTLSDAALEIAPLIETLRVETRSNELAGAYDGAPDLLRQIQEHLNKLAPLPPVVTEEVHDEVVQNPSNNQESPIQNIFGRVTSIFTGS